MVTSRNASFYFYIHGCKIICFSLNNGCKIVCVLKTVATLESVDILYDFCKWSKNVFIEAVTQKCSVKKVFLEIWQNSQETTCARVSFLIKLQASSCEFCEISQTPFCIEHFCWLLLFLIRQLLYLKSFMEYCKWMHGNSLHLTHLYTQLPLRGSIFYACPIFKTTFFLKF